MSQFNVYFNGEKIESFNGQNQLPAEQVRGVLLSKHPYLEGASVTTTEEGYYFTKKAKTLG